MQRLHCRTPRNVDMAALSHPPQKCVHTWPAAVRQVQACWDALASDAAADLAETQMTAPA